MTLPVAAQNALGWWSTYYGNHQPVSIAIRYLHLAALVVGGGAALTCDRVLKRTRHSGSAARSSSLDFLAASHRTVLPSLALMTVTGLLMMAADFDTYRSSTVFWLKMALVVLLAANGALLFGGERRAREGDVNNGWRRLGFTSTTSQVLWLSIVLVSCWLVVA